jgi:hypothetical protein
MFVIKALLGMILLGVLSGVVSYYNKNYFVRVFNDIMGTEEDDRAEVRVGRGFLYGFLFPIYFVLLLTGLIALVAFLVAAGIIAAVVFVLVWITEKILPHAFFGEPLVDLYAKIGLKPRSVPAQPATVAPAQEASGDKPEGPTS